MPDKKILFLVNVTWEELKAKGVAEMIYERDEFGYFAYVYSVHFPAFRNQVIKLNQRHTLLEFKGKTNNRFLNKMGGSYLFLFLKMPIVAWQLSKLIKYEDINIIRSIDPFHTGVLGVVLSKITGKPLCISIHADHDFRFNLNRRRGITLLLLKLMRKFSLKRAHLIMPIRESLVKQLMQYGILSDRIRVIPHGIDLAPFNKPPDGQLKKQLNLNDEKLVVFAGRLRRENYIYDIVDIADKTSAIRQDVRFLMLGSGYEEGNFKKAISQAGLSGYFILPGFLPRDKVLEYRKLADVNLCLMGGFSLLEAAASGKPVIAYDVEWHYEVIENNKTGLLIEEGNISEAANGIIKLLNEPQFSFELGNNAKKLVFDRYSLQEASGIKVKCYEELLKKYASSITPGHDNWYTDDQIKASHRQHLRLLFNDRMKFLNEAIDTYKKKHDNPVVFKVLDAGCGDGAIMSGFAKKEGLELYGIDYNPIRVERIKENVKNSHILQADLTNLCFRKESFNIVVLNQVLEHIKNDESVLKELHGILRPDGIFLFGIPNEGCFLANLRNKHVQPSISKTTDHVNFYRENIIKDKLLKSGFVIKSVRREGFFLPHYLLWAAMASTTIGYSLLNILGRIFTSQVCGFYFVCEKVK